MKKDLQGKRQGDRVAFYLYRDSNGILRGLSPDKIEVNRIYSLKAKEITKEGVIFDFKDGIQFFMPFKERTYRILKDMTYPVGLLVDDKNFLYLTSKIRNMLLSESPYKENDLVKGRIYSINKDIGAFIVIDDKYDSLLRKEELRGAHIEGELVEARVKQVKSDGKIELSLRQRSYLEIDGDAKKILKELKKSGGEIDLGDKSSPAEIEKKFGLSKSSFKKAIGRLYKKDLLKIYDKKIVLNKGEKQWPKKR